MKVPSNISSSRTSNGAKNEKSILEIKNLAKKN
jgi:hypothetical protein